VNELAIKDVVGDVFDRMFGAVAKPKTQAEIRHYWIANRAQQLGIQYGADPKKIAMALDEIAMHLVEKYGPLLNSLLVGDYCEIGRQTHRAVTSILADAAYQDACDEYDCKDD
jgi:hypothetical protein